MVSIESLVTQDPLRMSLLYAASTLCLPDWYIAAGFVRNMVWDHLHGYTGTPLNDVDVIYFDASKRFDDCELERQLKVLQPEVTWQVKNQAVMHIRNQDPPYKNSSDAMCYWPEKETALGVRLSVTDDLELATPFGVDSLWAGLITHNPERDRQVFNQRVASKGWLVQWPQLQIAG